MPKRTTVVEPAAKAHRIAIRKDLGSLRDLVVSPSTIKRYDQALSSFFEWMRNHKLKFPRDSYSLDELCTDFVCDLWEEGESRSIGANLLSALQHKIPSFKHNLPAAWRLIGAWARREMPARAPPLTIELVKALCGAALARRRGDVAVIIYAAFDLLLRTIEALSLKASDIVVNSSGTGAVVSLGLTKTGQRHGAAESVTTKNPFTCRLLATRLQFISGDQPLFNGSQAEFRALFKTLCDDLCLGDWQFRPYSLRRGGATHHFKESGQLSSTIVKGRWGSARAARVYINDGLATLAQFRFNAQTSQLIATRVREFTALMQSG